MMFGYGGHGAWWPVMSIGMVVFVALIIWALFAFTRTSTQANASVGSKAEARNTLDQRLASGAIDDQEYTRLRGLISQEDLNPIDSNR